MPSYIIAIRNSVSDAEGLAAYSAAAGGARRPDMKVLAARGHVETLEGSNAESVVLIEFPDTAAAKAWYDSPAYQDARKLRLAAADYTFILFEGL